MRERERNRERVDNQGIIKDFFTKPKNEGKKEGEIARVCL